MRIYFPKKTGVMLAICILCLLFSHVADAKSVKRHILAVIDSSELKNESFNLIAQFAQMPLEHLGYVVDYADITKHLPNDKEMEKYAGIISWFQDNKLSNAENYAKWLTRQLTGGVRAIILNNFGCIVGPNGKLTDHQVLNTLYNAFEVEFEVDEVLDNPLLLDIAFKDPSMVEFERTLDDELIYYVQVHALSDAAQIALKLKRKDTGAASDVVFTSPKGGFALQQYAIFTNANTKEARWRIDPFKFFSRALETNFPAPDVTTVNGSRLAISHIDGDGIANISHLDGREFSGKLIMDRILKNYAFPVSVSVMVGDLALIEDERRDELMSLMREIFALPNVEPASHGWAHPMDWTKEKREMGYNIPGYVYSAKGEIGFSIDYINNNLLPEGKRTNIFFWTGNCNPDAEAMRYVENNGILNFNGGDARFDNERPSYIYVAPLFRYVDGMAQNYTPAANEMIYTNDWTEPLYGFRDVIDTFKNTESPRRIRPIDIYYHFYSMENDASAKALLSVYDWVMKQETAREYVSSYLEKLNGFRKAKIEEISSRRFAVSNYGALRTFRFDNTSLQIDMAASKGVIGWLKYQGSLYVHLNDGERAEIVLSSSHIDQPYIAVASGEIQKASRDKKDISFSLSSIGPYTVRVRGLFPGRIYDIINGSIRKEMMADFSGEIALDGESASRQFEWIPIEVKLRNSKALSLRKVDTKWKSDGVT